jgi:steroid 5-alpha reductase family enzyme
MVQVKKRSVSFLIILAIYAVAFITSYFLMMFIRGMHLLLSTLIANIAATIVVWVFGIIFKNSSVYDPYWSVAPIVIILFWIIKSVLVFTINEALFLSAVLIWGVRLTLNWAIRFKGMGHQDWRYSMLKQKNPRMWFFTNLMGINIMPTLIVYVCLIPAYYGIGLKVSANILTILGFVICVSATFIQYFADKQMGLFKKERLSLLYIDRGLWRYSRHPNYFGEVFFWWGIWIMQMSIDPSIWLSILGPISMTILFISVSIPIMEKHMLSRIPGYKVYQKKVSILIPWFRAKK